MDDTDDVVAGGGKALEKTWRELHPEEGQEPNRIDPVLGLPDLSVEHKVDDDNEYADLVEATDESADVEGERPVFDRASSLDEGNFGGYRQQPARDDEPTEAWGDALTRDEP